MEPPPPRAVPEPAYPDAQYQKYVLGELDMILRNVHPFTLAVEYRDLKSPHSFEFSILPISFICAHDHIDAKAR
jgi:hypothetical protein